MTAAKLLDEWRAHIFERDYQHSLLCPSAILDNQTLLDLVSYGPMDAAAATQVLEGRWTLWSLYGDELISFLGTIPSIVYTGTSRKKPVRTSTADEADGSNELPTDLEPLMQAAESYVKVTFEETGWTALADTAVEALSPHVIKGFRCHTYDARGKSTVRKSVL